MDSTPINNVHSSPNGTNSAEGDPTRPVHGTDAPASKEMARQATTTIDTGRQVDATNLPMDPALLAALIERAALTIRASMAEKAPLTELSLSLPSERAPIIVSAPDTGPNTRTKNLLDILHARSLASAPTAEDSLANALPAELVLPVPPRGIARASSGGCRSGCARRYRTAGPAAARYILWCKRQQVP